MTWRERRIVTILSTILLILMAALLVVLGMRYRASRDIGNEDPVSGDTAVAADQNAYTSLQYDNGSTTLSFTRDENGTWTWDGSRDFPLDDTVITSILELLTNWKPQQILTGAHSRSKERPILATITEISRRTTQERNTPMAQPIMHSTTLSSRNCCRITPRPAPMAFRMPISRVRSVTVTSMMFIMPMPPTTREMAAIPPSSTVRMPVTLVMASSSISWERME